MSDAASVRFRRAYWRVFRDLDAVRLRQWEQSGVTLPQLRVLYQVRRKPEITTKSLARALGVTVSTTSGLVIKLVERGLIDRLTDAQDRRQAPLRLTPAGEALTGELAEPAQRFLAGVAERLGGDLGAVSEALERLAEAADAARLAAPLDEPAPATHQATR
jgi:DNA-binding MarR family transcriptional regulator